MAKVLIIDDDRMVCTLLCEIGTRMGHDVTYALSLGEGLRKIVARAFDVVFLDVYLPDGNGLDLLPEIREMPSRPEVIIFTGAGDPDGAELAIKNGAWDYVQKPASCEAIRLPLVRALQFREQKAVKSHIRKSGKAVRAFKREGIVGDSLKMEACMDLLAQAAGSNANVLITGETGTGKELFACAIHENSSRAGKAFVVVDCAALAESLVESVLFGHEKGAFTGADKAQDGMIKQADGGTLFLDEVGELPPSVQKAFLRVLQEHRFRRLGGKEEDHSDFRLIAATNRDLEQMVREGQFRKDLFFRLRSLSIEAPLLRDRVEDIKDLAIHHMAKQCERYGTCTKGLSPEFLNALTSYDWPGNVRELVHTMESSLIAARSEPILYPDHLPVHVRIQVARTSIARAAPNAAGPREVVEFCCRLPTMQDSREAAVADAERNYLQRLMYLTGTNIKEACKMAGLSRSQLYALLKKHGITRSGRPVESVEESGVSG